MNRNHLLVTMLVALAVGLPLNPVWGEPPSFTEEKAAYQNALQYIEQYRKNSVTITILDQTGRPVTGANVSYTQSSHDFVFGIFGSGGWGVPYYNDTKGWKLYSHLCQETNATVDLVWEMWSEIEPRRGAYTYFTADRTFNEILDRCPTSQFVLHFSDFNCCNLNSIPSWALSEIHDLKNATTFGQFKRDYYDYVNHVVRRYSARVKLWIVGDEMNRHPFADLLGGPGGMMEVDRVTIQAIRDVKPGAHVVLMAGLPDGDVIDPLAFARLALLRGLQFDAFSFEAYPWKDWSLNAEGTPVFYRQYAKSMADLGRPVFIQETGYPSEGCGELCVDNWPAWNRVFDESTQAAWVRYMLGIAFGTEGIIGVTSWFVDLRPDDWSVQSFKSMGLATRDGRAKQAYSAYLDEVENFTTSGRGITDAQGRVSFRGFAGYYTIAVTAADGQRSKIGIHVLQLSNSTHAGRQDFTITFAPHPMVNSTSTTIQIATTTSAIVMTSPSQTVVTTSSQEITPSPNYEPYIIAGVIGIVAAVCFAVVRRRTRRKLE